MDGSVHEICERTLVGNLVFFLRPSLKVNGKMLTCRPSSGNEVQGTP